VKYFTDTFGPASTAGRMSFSYAGGLISAGANISPRVITILALVASSQAGLRDQVMDYAEPTRASSSSRHVAGSVRWSRANEPSLRRVL
jgi:hypothetical protein